VSEADEAGAPVRGIRHALDVAILLECGSSEAFSFDFTLTLGP
jgi:hypothetical protein